MLPLQLPEFFRDRGIVLRRTVNNDGDQESLVLGHVMGAFDGEIPLVSKVPLKPFLGMPGDDWDKRTQSWISCRIFLSQASPPRSSL